MRAGTLLMAGVTGLVVGMVLAFLGILTPTLFVPATRVILLALLACAAAGAVALVERGAAATGTD